MGKLSKLLKRLFKGANDGVKTDGDIRPSGLDHEERDSMTATTQFSGARMLPEPVEVGTMPQRRKTRSGSSEQKEVGILQRPAKERTPSQLIEEFRSHLVAELSDGACRDNLEACVAQSCSNTTQSVVREAIQAIASKFASCICDHFAEKWTQEVDAAKNRREKLLPSKPETVDEYEEFLSEFARQNLSKFRHSWRKTIGDIAERAVQYVSSEEVGPELAELGPGLAKLALYDFIILCGM